MTVRGGGVLTLPGPRGNSGIVSTLLAAGLSLHEACCPSLPNSHACLRGTLPPPLAQLTEDASLSQTGVGVGGRGRQPQCGEGSVGTHRPPPPSGQPRGQAEAQAACEGRSPLGLPSVSGMMGALSGSQEACR